MKNILFPSLIAGAMTAVSSAAIINIDLGRTAGISSGNWNNVHGASGSALATPTLALIDDTGAASGLTLNTDFSNGGSWAGGGADYAGAYPAAVTGLAGSALSDSMFIRSAAFVTLTLTGLDSGSSYDFMIYGARGNTGGTSLYTLTGGNGVQALSITDVLNNSTELATATGVTPNGSNEITLVYTTASSSDSGGLNMIQITSNVVPEPSSAALLGLAGLALIRRRRN